MVECMDALVSIIADDVLGQWLEYRDVFESGSDEYFTPESIPRDIWPLWNAVCDELEHRKKGSTVRAQIEWSSESELN